MRGRSEVKDTSLCHQSEGCDQVNWLGANNRILARPWKAWSSTNFLELSPFIVLKHHPAQTSCHKWEVSRPFWSASHQHTLARHRENFWGREVTRMTKPPQIRWWWIHMSKPVFVPKWIGESDRFHQTNSFHTPWVFRLLEAFWATRLQFRRCCSASGCATGRWVAGGLECEALGVAGAVVLPRRPVDDQRGRRGAGEGVAERSAEVARSEKMVGGGFKTSGD